jgi:hypothetical protein
MCNAIDRSTLGGPIKKTGHADDTNLAPGKLFDKVIAETDPRSNRCPEGDILFMLYVARLIQKREDAVVKGAERFLVEFDKVLPIWHLLGLKSSEMTHHMVQFVTWVHEKTKDDDAKSLAFDICKTIALAQEARRQKSYNGDPRSAVARYNTCAKRDLSRALEHAFLRQDLTGEVKLWKTEDEEGDVDMLEHVINDGLKKMKEKIRREVEEEIREKRQKLGQ